MKISQAIYTSAHAELVQGYHLVSKSPGLDERVAQSLCCWSPSHGCLCEDGTDAESLNFFRPVQDWFVLSRSIYGSPEYSQRGGLRVLTINLVFHTSQLAKFENDVIACAVIALSMGLLTLPLVTPRNLTPVNFPEFESHSRIEYFDASAMTGLLQTSKPVALVGADNPLAFLSGLFQNTPPHERLKLSFATGLKPSNQRPFRFHFFRSVDGKLKNVLMRGGYYVSNYPKSTRSARLRKPT